MRALAFLATALILPAQDSVQQVFDRVAATFHLRDGRRPPSLKVLAKQDGPPRGAYFDPNTREILVEQDLIDRLRKDSALGDDALAFVLGHELAHFYGDHRLTAATGQLPPDRLRYLEEEADRKAILHAHLAGYGGASVAPAVIQAIYTFYGLPSDLEGYPSLEVRASSAGELVTSLRPLLPLYPLAIALILNEDLAEAALVLDYLGDQFHSPDLVHNAAVLQARIGLAKSPAAPYAGLYPFLFATQNNLGSSLSGSRGGAADGRPLLESAEIRLRRILSQSPQDPSVRINLALTLDLLGRPSEGLTLLTNAASFPEPFRSHRQAAQAILWQHSRQPLKATSSARGLPNTDLWDRFLRNAPPALRAARSDPKACPELTGLAERSGLTSNSLWHDAVAIKNAGKVPGDDYDLSLQVAHTPGALAARVRSHEASLRVFAVTQLQESEQKALTVYYGRAAATSELNGVPVSYRRYHSPECTFVLGARAGAVTEVFFLDPRW